MIDFGGLFHIVDVIRFELFYHINGKITQSANIVFSGIACVEATVLITDIRDVYADIASVEELERLLSVRYTGLLQKYDPTIDDVEFNRFTLRVSDQEHPQLRICVFGELANALYMPQIAVSGFSALGSFKGLEARGFTTFYISQYPADAILVPNYSVIPMSTAVAVAGEFLETRLLPKSIEWFEL